MVSKNSESRQSTGYNEVLALAGIKMKIEQIDPDEAENLISELDEYQKKLYPPESCHLDSLETLQGSNVRFYGVIEDGEIIAIGSVKLFTNYGEVKRLYVPVEQRRKGLAKMIMGKLEDTLIKNSIYISRLETGPESREAIKFYLNFGYIEREKFGDYKDDPLSTFMEKLLNKRDNTAN